MKTIKRLAVLTGAVAVAGTLLTSSASAATSATGVSPYNGSSTAGPGGSFGIGNCGYNNGAGRGEGPTSPTSPGLGGFRKNSDCKPAEQETLAPPAPEAEPEPDAQPEAVVEAEETSDPVIAEDVDLVVETTKLH